VGDAHGDRAGAPFGAALRRHRLAAGLTQEALAERAGVSARAVSDLERGLARAPHRDTVARLGEALGLGDNEATELRAAVERRRGPPNHAPASRQPLAPGNLPAELTTFVGRREDVAALERVVGEHRLVTLTGAGGVGKTRLALRLAEAVRGGYPDGVWFVDLAPLGAPALVPETVATVLGVRAGDRPALAALRAGLGSRRLLLVLDNCEHLVDGCAELVDAVLRVCPGVTVLATSREPLRAAGEVTWRVPSLPAPPDEPLAAADALEYPSVRLFADRAGAALPGFAVTEAHAQAVARICRRLDGVPLAIELAAVRVRALTPEQIADRLEDRFRLLTAGERTAVPRHRTLRATLDWSHDLLDDRERALLRRLAVFAGGFTLEAAEAACAGDGVAGADVLELLASLVDKSMVVVESQGGFARYRLLETVRHYALERLAAAAESERVRRCHRDWYVAWAEQAAAQLTSRDQAHWTCRLAAEHDNLRTALAWSRDEENGAEAELRLAAALGRFWLGQGHSREGQRWLRGALARSGPAATTARAAALDWAGRLAISEGDYTTARRLIESSVAVAREVGDGRLTALALRHLVYIALATDDDRAARLLAEEALEAARRAGDAREIATGFANLGRLARRSGDRPAARRLLEESLALARRAEDSVTIGETLGTLGRIAADEGDHARARALFEERLAIGQTFGSTFFDAMAYVDLGDLARAQADHGEARRRYRQSLRLAREAGDAMTMAGTLVRCAGLDAAVGGFEEAARLFGAEDAWRTARRTPRPAEHVPWYERDVANARAGLSEAAFAAAWSAGQQMALEQAVACALDDGLV
jgi:non-specific serine/threonine protein kinase